MATRRLLILHPEASLWKELCLPQLVTLVGALKMTISGNTCVWSAWSSTQEGLPLEFTKSLRWVHLVFQGPFCWLWQGQLCEIQPKTSKPVGTSSSSSYSMIEPSIIEHLLLLSVEIYSMYWYRHGYIQGALVVLVNGLCQQLCYISLLLELLWDECESFLYICNGWLVICQLLIHIICRLEYSIKA